MFRALVSGAVATTAMSAVLLLARSAGAIAEPPPQKATRAALPDLPKRDVPGTAIVAHYGVGLAGAVAYALWPRRIRGWHSGIAHGLGIWALGYESVLPRLGALPPAHRDDPERVATMVVAHVVYGGTLGATRRGLDRRAARKAERRAAATGATAGRRDGTAGDVAYAAESDAAETEVRPDESWSVARLRLLAQSRDLPGYSRMRKRELVRALR